MIVNDFGKIGIREKASCTIPWGKSPAAIPNDLLVEGDVRDIFQQESKSCFLLDNGPDDLDPAKGRALFNRTLSAEQLALGRVDSVQEYLADDKGVQTSFQIQSRDKNFFSEVKWENGEIQSVREERVLRDGTVEVLDIRVNSGSGTLTYLTDLVPGSKS